MNTDWRTLMQEEGGVFEAQMLCNFGDEAAERSAAQDGEIIADLSAWGFILARGADCETFLQGQLANDIRMVNASQSQLSAYCSPKGRILASLRVVPHADGYLLRLPHTTLASTLQRLRMFVLRSRVTLEDASEAVVSLGISGPLSSTRLGELADGLPATVNAVRQTEALTLVRLADADGRARFECYGPPSALGRLWHELRGLARPVASPTWAWLDIQAGVPHVYPETVDSFVPQMLNLQAIEGISFNKGCYPGQEIVARTQYLGKLKRRMFRAHSASEQCPTPGSDIYAEADPSGQSAGKVVDARHAPRGGVDLLAVIQLASLDSGPLHLGSAAGPTLTLADLPYALET